MNANPYQPPKVGPTFDPILSLLRAGKNWVSATYLLTADEDDVKEGKPSGFTIDAELQVPANQ